METRHHDDLFSVDSEQDAVRKAANDGAPDGIVDDGKLERILLNGGERRIDYANEFCAEALRPLSVPLSGLIEFTISLGPNDELPTHP